MLGAAAGLCVGFGTRAFLWSLAASGTWVKRVTPGGISPTLLLPLALPACVFLIRRFAPTARGHGTEAVIAAIHRESGRIPWKVAPIKLLATVVTLAFGGSVGKEGPCAQIGAAITSLFADVLRLNDDDRRRLVICGIGGGFAAVFGTPISGALFGIEVLYLGRIEYAVLFPCLVSGIVAHLVCGSRAPVPVLPEGLGGLGRSELVGLSIVFGAVFGLVALLLIEAMRGLERGLRRFEEHPYLVAAAGGVFLAAFYALVGDTYAGLGVPTIESALAATGTIVILAFLWKIVATTVTLGTGGSGGIVTPLFFIGATSGAALARLLHLPTGALRGLRLRGRRRGRREHADRGGRHGHRAPAAGRRRLRGAHRGDGVSPRRAPQRLRKPEDRPLEVGGLDVPLEGPIGDLTRSGMHVRKGSLTERARGSGSAGPPRANRRSQSSHNVERLQ